MLIVYCNLSCSRIDKEKKNGLFNQLSFVLFMHKSFKYSRITSHDTDWSSVLYLTSRVTKAYINRFQVIKKTVCS